MSQSLVIPLDQKTIESLEMIAASRSISQEEAVQEAINNLVEYETWFKSKVNQGEEAYKSGKYVSQDEATLIAAERRNRLLKMAGKD